MAVLIVFLVYLALMGLARCVLILNAHWRVYLDALDQADASAFQEWTHLMRAATEMGTFTHLTSEVGHK